MTKSRVEGYLEMSFLQPNVLQLIKSSDQLNDVWKVPSVMGTATDQDVLEGEGSSLLSV